MQRIPTHESLKPQRSLVAELYPVAGVASIVTYLVVELLLG